jgi:hypothetical protein
LNGSPLAEPEYEIDRQSISTMGDIDDVANIVDIVEGGQGAGSVKSMVRNSESEDSDLDAEIAVSRKVMEGVAVVAESSANDSVSY